MSPTKPIRRDIPDLLANFHMDTCSFADHHNDLVSACGSQHGRIIILTEQNTIQSNCIMMQNTRLTKVESELKRTRESLESMADRIAADYHQGPPHKSQKVSATDAVLPFSDTHNHLKRNPRPKEVFTCFFDKQAKPGHCSEMNSNKFKCVPQSSGKEEATT